MYLGDFKEDSTLYFCWNTNDKSGASIAPSVAGTISVYKDKATDTESTAGITTDMAYDTIVGVHNVEIVLTDAFYTVGHDYHVILTGATIDGETVNAVLATFSIENRFSVDVALRTTVASVTTPDTVFTLTAGAGDDDAYNNMTISIKDISSGDVRSRRITDYAQSTKTVTVDYDFEFTLAVGDIVTIFASSYSQTAGAAAVSEIADMVWDELDAEHMTPGTKGLKMHHAGKGR